MRRLTVLGAAVVLALASAAPAMAQPAVHPTGPSAKNTVTASGSFTFTTSSGVLPTWEAADLRIVGIAPGSALTSATTNAATVVVPIVAKNGSANFAAGGFRINNVAEGTFVNCANPVIDTGARVVDCVFPDGTNASVFVISGIGSRTRSTVGGSNMAVFRDVQLRVASTEMADDLNRALRVRVFSPSITVAVGELEVRWGRAR
jgi:hypothetical protein